MRRMPRILAALVALLVILPAATASATFDGSTGKVAYVDSEDGLYIDDPFDDQPAQGPLATVASNDLQSKALAMPSPPAWSPDGTLLAYSAPVDDSFGLKHSAIFVMKADGTGARQVSHPFALEPNTCTNDCDNGHASLDHSPTWTPDGKIAFIRMVYSGDESPRVGERGTSVRIVDPAGGGAGQRYYLEPRANGLIFSIVWPTSSIHPFAILGDKPDKTFSVRNLGTNTDIVSAMGITDLDASPVGQKLAHTTLIDGPRVHVIDFAGRALESFTTGFELPQIRFTPDGNSIARKGCARDREQRQHCGIVTHRLEDPDGDVREDDPLEMPFLDMQALVRVPAWPGRRSNFDIQSQDLPVILIPGFLGSEIQCDGDDVWMPLVPPIVMRPMALSADGRTNQNCASAETTGRPVGRFLGSDVYVHLEEWLKRLKPPAGGATFGWDWRRAPDESLDELEEKIDELIEASELATAQGAKRAVLAGHSYGGVLMRLFIDDEARSRKVARMLNVGVPMWGSIKPFFPLTFGIEGIGVSALDMFVENEDLKDTMRNFPGAYHLLAGDNFGQWLTVDGLLDQAGVKAYLQSVGGNGVLFEDARRTHADGIDGWLDYGGRIDVRTVVGVGLLTTHRVDVESDPAEGDADVTVELGDGDITVPAFSARQRHPGGPMMGDPIHIQERCDIQHMDQTKDAVVQHAYTQFLLFGRTPRKLPEPECDLTGDVIEFSKDLPIPPPVSTELAADAAMSLGQAQWEGKADVIDLPGGTKVVVNDAAPVALKVAADGLTMTVTDVDEGGPSRRVTYGPLTGNVVIGPGAGDVPAVSVDGKPVSPAHDTGGGGQTPPPGDVVVTPPGDVVVTPPPGDEVVTPHPGPALVAGVRGGRVKLSKAGVAAVRVQLRGGSGTGVVALTANLGRRTVRIGSAHVALPAGRRVKAKVKVSKAARRAVGRGGLRAFATLSVSGAAPAKAVVRLGR
jgi:pimeloyl-ACP methyl ester carboxylesterase